MSRTRKDRPEWVKRNDPTLLFYSSHEHLSFGYQFYKNFYPLDDEGNYISELKTISWLEPTENNITSGQTWVKKEYSYLTTKTERHKVFTYPNHCTINDPVSADRHERRYGNPCEKQLILGQRNDVDKKDKSHSQGKSRAANRVQLSSMCREANNSNHNILDDSNILCSESHHRYGWWT